MCVRYRLTQAKGYAEINGIRNLPTVSPRFNINPRDQIAVVLDESPDTISEASWGLVPSWAEDTRVGAYLINAHVDNITTKPAYREAFMRRHCLIAADGFFEWQKVGTLTQPYNICLKNGEPFSFAGLWESWKDPDGKEIRTCTIITCEPNDVMFRIHYQMPVILPVDKTRAWLDSSTSKDERLSLLCPYDSTQMIAYPISKSLEPPSVR